MALIHVFEVPFVEKQYRDLTKTNRARLEYTTKMLNYSLMKGLKCMYFTKHIDISGHDLCKAANMKAE